MAETSSQRNLLICLSLTTAALFVYAPVLQFGFVHFDDRTYVAMNPHLRGGMTLESVGWALTTALDQWMPVTWLARILECQWFGMNSGVHHLINVLFHIANTWLLFGILNRTTAAPWRSALVAALFALHPLHVESVAWVTGLKDVLSMFFGLLTIWAYVRYTELLNAERGTSNSEHRTPSPHPSPNAQRPTPIAFYCLTLLFFALALMSKPMLVTLPFVLLLLDYWPLGRTRWAEAVRGQAAKLTPGQLFKEKIPFFVFAAGSCAATIWGQHTAGAVATLENLPLGSRLAGALLSYAGYLGKTIWPARLAVFYPVGVKASWAAELAAAIGVAAITTAVIWRARREPWLATGWFLFLGMLVPVIGLVQVGIVQTMADRYTYIPLVGLFIMLCWSVPRHRMDRQSTKAAVWIVVAVALAACTMLARIQVGYWKNSETLFRHALNVTQNNWLAHGNLGMVLEEEGQVSEAITHYEEALRIQPGYPQAHYNLGNALLKMGRTEEAIGHWGQALRINPNFAEAHYNLGAVLMGLGRLAEAVEHLEQAVRLRPESPETHNALGAALVRAGRIPEAIDHYEQALRIQPNSPEYHNNLGIALFQVNRTQEAVTHCEQAVQLSPGYVQAYYNLGTILAAMGKTQEAIVYYEHAVRLKPDFVEAQNLLARLRAAQPRTEGFGTR
jgi:protein O-mannosyl-transferase